MGGQAVWAELVGFLGIVQEQSEDLQAAAKEATGAIMHLVGYVELVREKCLMRMRTQSLSQLCWILGLSLGLPRVFLCLSLSGAILAMFLDVFWPLPLGLPLVSLSTLAFGLLGKSWWNLRKSFGHI